MSETIRQESRDKIRELLDKAETSTSAPLRMDDTMKLGPTLNGVMTTELISHNFDKIVRNYFLFEEFLKIIE